MELNFIDTLQDSNTYIEIFLRNIRISPIESESSTLVNLQHDANVFHGLLNRIGNQRMKTKPSHKNFKRYRINDLVLEHEVAAPDVEDIRIYSHTVRDIVYHDHSKFIATIATKEKQMYHSFPCTTMIYDCHYVERVTFRLHHRVFLNFEKQIYMDQKDSPVFKVFFNINMDENIDTENIKNVINQYISQLSTYGL